MNYGIPSLMEYAQPEPLVRFCAEHGFRFVELNMTYPWFQSGTIDPSALTKLAGAHGISYTIHLHDQVNPFEFSLEMRQASLDTILGALDLAKTLEVPRITMHLLNGMYSSIAGKKVYLYQHCLGEYLSLVEAFRDQITRRLAGHDAIFCIENTGGYTPFQKEAILRLLESPVFGLTYDVGHDFKTCNMDAPFVLAHRDRLKHFHIHDCDANANHLALGAGKIDIPKALELVEQMNCPAVIEVKESHALAESRAYLERLHMWP